VDHTTNEITQFRPLLDRLDLTATVVTADALHTQHEHADWLVTRKHAAYVLVVKANQPTLHQQLATLPWREIPPADHTRDRSHGRVELRRLQVTTVAGLDFPHATQAIRITRRVRSLHSRRWRTVTCMRSPASPPPRPAPPAWPTGSGATGASRRCITSATPLSPRTPPRSAPATPPGPCQPAQPRHRPPARPRRPQHHRCDAPQRPRCHPSPTATWHHKPMDTGCATSEACASRPDDAGGGGEEM
jgi:predicted transposase YbfD/YdcC